MTIEIIRKKSRFAYRINEFNQREIMWRVNKHNARWKRLGTYDTQEEALAAMLQIQRDAIQEGKGDTDE